MNSEYLDELNPQQRAAVEYMDGPELVIAGAGSGKTRVLTYKVVHLLRHGYEPWRIMALTFTNKAAGEMKERVAAVLGDKRAQAIWMGTFHSVFLRILRQNAQLLGFNSNFTIYDAADSRALVKTIIKDLGLDEKNYRPAAIASVISMAKNNLQTAQQYQRDKDNERNDRYHHRPMTGRIFELYVERCRLAQAMDFDDILFYTNTLLRDHPDVLRHYQEHFQYILVDEYQDTNFAQHLIVSQLAKLSGGVCVVGDDAQSIYSFRGANIDNILSLEKHYPGLRTFKLERNYRSTQNIINAAGSLIKANQHQLDKHVYSENAVGQAVRVIRAYSDLEESVIVANSIAESRQTHHDSYDDYAILYRTNAQSRILEESLRRRSIPYRIYGGLSFYQRKEVKDAVCYFRLALNPDDDEALRRVINYPARGIGETTVKKLSAAAIAQGVSLWHILSNASNQAETLKLNRGTLSKLAAFAELINLFIADNAKGANAFELAQLIYNRTGMLAVLQHDDTPEAISRQENLSELLAGLKEFVETRLETGEESASMADFISEVSLATDQDKKENDDEPKVTLMTAHAAKGLEFSNIYIVGVEEDLFPNGLCADSAEGVEEERRLLYVAITRAKNYCTLTYTGSRFRNGQTMLTRPSRFLRDFDTKYVEFVTSEGIQSPAGTAWTDPRKNFESTTCRGTRMFAPGDPAWVSLRTNSRRSSSTIAKSESVDNAELLPGRYIVHNRYGRGVIVEKEDAGADTKIIVDFESVGVKRLLTRIAVFHLE